MGSTFSSGHRPRVNLFRRRKDRRLEDTRPDGVDDDESSEPKAVDKSDMDSDLRISFDGQITSVFDGSGSGNSSKRFSISGAGISANATFPTSVAQDESSVIDSPNNFVPLRRTNSDAASDGEFIDFGYGAMKSNHDGPSSKALLDVVLNSGSVKTAGGPAGEDRLQTLCSEENGWLFCGIYDGFNGRDASDFVASNLCKTIAARLKITEDKVEVELDSNDTLDSFQSSMMQCLRECLKKTEDDFFSMVELEREGRPELPMIGCCFVCVLLYGDDLFTMNLGDSKAVLAAEENGSLVAVQLTSVHSANDTKERNRVESEHPDEETFKNGRLMGKLKVTRAFGAGFLKSAKFNDFVPPFFRVKGLKTPPYLSSEPYVTVRKVQPEDKFLVVGSDGLFDFFSNEELIHAIAEYKASSPEGDVAKFLVEATVQRAAKKAGMSVEELKAIPQGDRRKYHDDVTLVFVSLEEKVQTACASFRYE